jgi:integrase
LWLDQRHVEVCGGQWHDPGRGAELFGAYGPRWLAERDLRPRTRAHYRHLLDHHLLPTFGGLRLDAITPATVNGWHRRFRSGPTARAHSYSLLKTILASAVADEIIPRNPCTIRGASTAKRATETEPATLDELDVIRENMPDRLALIIDLAAWCALRFGELAGLRRRDVDVERGTIKVRRSVAFVKTDDDHPDGRSIGEPKSQAGKRTVAIPPHILPAVEAHLAEHTEPGPDGLLFTAVGGGYLGSRSLYNAYGPAREAAGREDLRFHDLRHTGAVLFAQTGATIAELMARLGHSTPEMAMRYQHASAERGRELAGRLSEMATVTPIGSAKRRRRAG